MMMTLESIKEAVEEIKKRYGVTHLTYLEDVIDNDVKFIEVKLRFKVTEKACFSLKNRKY